MRAPAVCETCDFIFPSGFDIENSENVSFVGSKSGPCPRCRGTGRIPDGTYNFIGSTIEFLSGPKSSVRDLQRLAELLKDARDKGATHEEIADEIQKNAPELASWKDVLPKSRVELYMFIGIVISIAALSMGSGDRITTNTAHTEQVINNIYQQSPATPTQRDGKKVGRNDPCPCGSGKKYKKCCIGPR